MDCNHLHTYSFTRRALGISGTKCADCGKVLSSGSVDRGMELRRKANEIAYKPVLTSSYSTWEIAEIQHRV